MNTQAKPFDLGMAVAELILEHFPGAARGDAKDCGIVVGHLSATLAAMLAAVKLHHGEATAQAAARHMVRCILGDGDDILSKTLDRLDPANRRPT